MVNVVEGLRADVLLTFQWQAEPSPCADVIRERMYVSHRRTDP